MLQLQLCKSVLQGWGIFENPAEGASEPFAGRVVSFRGFLMTLECKTRHA